MTDSTQATDPSMMRDTGAPGASRMTLWLVLALAVVFAAWWLGRDRAQPTTEPGLGPAPALATLPEPADDLVIAPTPARKAAPVVERRVLRDRAPALIAASRVVPNYPASALRSGDTGVVTVAATIDASGRPIKVGIDDRSGNRDLDRAAVAAVKQWRFQPALRNGKAVEGMVRVPVEFTLDRS